MIVETTKSYLQSGAHRLPITPGMMTDTQIITGRKSVLTYLLKPVLKARSEDAKVAWFGVCCPIVDQEKRLKMVWDIDHKLQAEIARPIIFYGRAAGPTGR